MSGGKLQEILHSLVHSYISDWKMYSIIINSLIDGAKSYQTKPRPDCVIYGHYSTSRHTNSCVTATL